MGRGGVRVILERYVSRTVFWQVQLRRGIDGRKTAPPMYYIDLVVAAKIIFVEGLGKVKVVKFIKQSKAWTSLHTVRPLQRIAALPDLRPTQDFERRQITFRYDAVHKSWVADLYLRRKHDDRDLR
jgi:hypothetical protein